MKKMPNRVTEAGTVKGNSGNKSVVKAGSGRDSVIEIIVGDNGIGIPAEYREKIFTPFYRAVDKGGSVKTEGSGLGLAIVRRIVELHGGCISYISEGEKGCKFRIIL